MIIFEAKTIARLAEIEALEGIPVDELVRQAVSVWTTLDRDERGVLGFAALQIVVQRARRPA